MLTKAKQPLPVLELLLEQVRAIESDMDEHDTPFPGRTPDMGAVHAYRRHFEALKQKASGGQAAVGGRASVRVLVRRLSAPVSLAAWHRLG